MATRNKPQISEFKVLPSELWFQILAKLPAKILLQFRCVCKSWCSVIDDPNFIEIHFQHSQIPNSRNNSSFLALEYMKYCQEYGNRLTLRHSETLQETGLIFWKPCDNPYFIIGSCNGLLLVRRDRSISRNPDELRLWNPCICKSLIIPTCPVASSRRTQVKYVFGFAPACKDYKVIAFAWETSSLEVPTKLYVAVYTLSDQQWTVRNDGFNITSSNIFGIWRSFNLLSKAVFVKGVVYWFGRTDMYTNDYSHLVSFDFDKEEISISKLPSSWEHTYAILFLLGESLAIFTRSNVATNIWMLEQDIKNGPWTRWFSGETSQDGRDAFYPFGKVFFRESDGGHFISRKHSYNIASCQVQHLTCFEGLFRELEMYLESLVLSNVYGARDLRFFP